MSKHVRISHENSEKPKFMPGKPAKAPILDEAVNCEFIQLSREGDGNFKITYCADSPEKADLALELLWKLSAEVDA